MNFSFLNQEIIKLRPQRITVKNPTLAVLVKDVRVDRYLSDKANHRQPSQYQGEIKARNISLKKHSTAFAQMSVLLSFEQHDG